MAEKSSFFTSLNGDRKYKASDFAEYFRTFIGNGVFPNPSSNLQVISNGDMTLTISPGFAWINGYMYNNTDNLILTLDNSDSALKRIDRVVIKCDFVNREIKAYIKKGVFSQSPAAPELTRDADAYELSVADILVENGIVSIQQSKITDTRLNSEVCGIVTQTVETIDTTELFNKLQAYIEERGKDVEGWINESIQTWSMDFTTWFDSIKDILNGDIAGELANRILELEDKVGSGLTANNILMEDGSTVEDTVTENKTSISNLNNRADNLNAQIGNLINTDNILIRHGYVTRAICENANSLDVNNGIFATDGNTVGVNEIGILDHKQWDINYAYQTFHPHTKAYLRFRHKSDNVWSEWREL